MKSSKNIKVYGTLVNHTLDSTLADETHNDALMNAYQLFDGRFGDSPLPNNFQDVINKRITDITFDGGTTTIENRDELTENHYTLVVNGDTNLNGDVHITLDLHVDGDTYLGDTHVDGDLYVTGDINGINLDDLDDVDVPSPSAKDLLYFLNGLWRSGNISTIYGDDIVNIINNASQVGWLSKLKDVNVIDRTDGQFLKYNVNGNNAKWIAANITFADIDDIADLLNAADNYVLKFYNGKWRPRPDDGGSQLPEGSEGKVLKHINGLWVAADDNDTKQLSALTDVNIPNVAAGNVLKYNGSKWVADTISTEGGGATKLSELSDVDSSVDSATNGQVLKFDGTKWVAANDEKGDSGNSGVVYRKYTVTLTKVALKNNIVENYLYNPEQNLKGLIYPGANNAYFYVSNSPLTLGDDEQIDQQYIKLSQFSTVPYVKTFSLNYSLVHPNGTQSILSTKDGTEQVDGMVPNANTRILTSTALSNTTSSTKIYALNLKCEVNNTSVSSYYTFQMPNTWSNEITFLSPNFLGPYTEDTSSAYTDPQHYFRTLELESGEIASYSGGSTDGNLYGAEYGRYVISINGSGRETCTTATISKADITNKLNLSNNSIFVEVGANKLFAGIIAANDYAMPNTITAVIITREVAEV